MLETEDFMVRRLFQKPIDNTTNILIIIVKKILMKLGAGNFFPSKREHINLRNEANEINTGKKLVLAAF